MLRLAIVLPLVLTASVADLAQVEPVAPADPTALPRRPLEAVETARDAGEVVEGTDARYRVTLLNHGNEPIKLTARTNCSCTVVSDLPTVPPKGRATVRLALKTRGFKGRVTKSVRIMANRPGQGWVLVDLSVTVRPLIRVTPSPTAQLIFPDKGTATTEFTLTPEPGHRVEFTQVVSDAPYLKTRLLPAAIPGGSRKLEVSVAPKAPFGHFQAMLTIFTNSSVTPVLKLSVSGEKGIAVSPPQVFLGRLPDSEVPAREEILLTKRGGQFHVKNVKSADPNLKVKCEPIRGGSMYRIVLSYAGGWKPGLVRQTVTVNTTDPRQPVLTIPVAALVEGASQAQIKSDEAQSGAK
jgi:Protein of unknown function (DUF1573)